MEKFSTEKYLNALLKNEYLTKYWRVNPRKKSRVKQSIFFITREFPEETDFKHRLRALRIRIYKYRDIKCPIKNCNNIRKFNKKYHLTVTCGLNDELHKSFFSSHMSQKCKNSRTKEDRLISAEKAKETFLKKYGVNNPMKSKDIRKKAQQTNLEKYGVRFPTQSKKITKKRKLNNLKKYSVDEPSKLPEIKEKIKQTCLQKYGVISSAKSPHVKKKMFDTNFKKYGVKMPTQNKDIQNKIKNTNLKKYGVSCVFASQIIKEKIKQTNLEKYGYFYATQSPKIKQKIKDKWPETKRKIEIANLKKYGFPYAAQSLEVRQKLKDKWPETKKKLEATNLKKYGYLYAAQSPTIKPKIEATNLKKYGFPYAAQSLEVRQKLKDKWPETKKKIEATTLDRYKAKTFMQAHLKNTHLLTKDYLEENFLDENRYIKLQEMMQFYNMKETACYRYMRINNIKIRYKDGGFNPDKPAILYYIYDPQEDLYKIGITNNTVEERFGKTFCSNRAIAILEQIYYDNGQDAYIAEQEILKQFAYSRCINESWPKELGGQTEFFKEDILNLNNKE